MYANRIQGRIRGLEIRDRPLTVIRKNAPLANASLRCELTAGDDIPIPGIDGPPCIPCTGVLIDLKRVPYRRMRSAPPLVKSDSDSRKTAKLNQGTALVGG